MNKFYIALSVAGLFLAGQDLAVAQAPAKPVAKAAAKSAAAKPKAAGEGVTAADLDTVRKDIEERTGKEGAEKTVELDKKVLEACKDLTSPACMDAWNAAAKEDEAYTAKAGAAGEGKAAGGGGAAGAGAAGAGEKAESASGEESAGEEGAEHEAGADEHKEDAEAKPSGDVAEAAEPAEAGQEE